MGKPFEYIGALQCENRILRKKVADYESGERFQQIQMEHQKVLDESRRQIKRLKQTIENLRKDVRKAWKWCEEAYEDALKELNAQMKDLEHALKRLKECALPQNNAVIRHCLRSLDCAVKTVS